MLKFGFDIGVASVGWSVVEVDSKDFEIKGCGVRIFTGAEHPKTGASLALPRRIARGARARLNHKKNRLNSVKFILCEELKLNPADFKMHENKLPPIFQTDKLTISPWHLRVKALKERLAPAELARVIFHIAKHRGYDDLRYPIVAGKAPSSGDSDEKKAKKSAAENLLAIKDFPSGAAMLLNRLESKEITSLRNKKTGDATAFHNSLPQSAIKAELDAILDAQIRAGAKFSAEFRQKLTEHIFFSRPVADTENMVGKCEFFADENRAPKFSPLAQEFIAATAVINTLKGPNLATKQNIEAVIAAAKKKGKLKVADVNKALDLTGVFFGDKTLVDFTKYKALIKICSKFGDEFCAADNPKFNEIARICTYKKDFSSLKNALSEFEFSDLEIGELLDLKLTQNINLSLKALSKILPLMKNGLLYNEACDEAGLKPVAATQKYDLLPPLCETHFSLENPVVARSVAQYRKVLNALIKEYGAPCEIRFELAREAKKSFEERKKIEKMQDERAAINEKARVMCSQLNMEINSGNLLKIKLWWEQDEFCPYSDKKITIKDLQDSQALEIDHILPYSRSFDDSFNNKVLCHINQNQEKLDKTPFEAWGNTRKWKNIKVGAGRIEKKNPTKYKNLLIQDFRDREQGFRQRNYNDTAHMCRVIMNYTKEYLKLAKPEGDKKQQIFSINGGLTSVLRKFWGLGVKDRSNDLHHAQDALIIAMSDERMVKKLSEYMRDLEEWKKRKFQHSDEFSQKVADDLKNTDYKTKITFDKYAEFAPNFRQRVLDATNEIFVSRPPIKKTTGALHDETVYDKKSYILRNLYTKAPAVDEKMEQEFEKNLKFGRIARINGGYVTVKNIVRTDVFTKNGKFYLVPIYAMHFARAILPNSAISGETLGGRAKITEIDDSFKFRFSLFKNDLVELQTKEITEPIKVYFQAPNSSSGGLFMYETPDRKKSQPLITTITMIKKMKVSVLGKTELAEFEPRMGVKTRKK